jgi:hypothetical protein
MTVKRRGPNEEKPAMAPAWATTAQYLQVAGWGGLIAAVLVLTSLFTAVVTIGTAEGLEQTTSATMIPLHSALSAPHVQSGMHEGTNRAVSPATAALADGDDVRAGFPAGAPIANCAMQPLYARQSSWAPLYSRCTDALP